MTREQTFVAILVFATEVTTTVLGQLLLKHAMEGSKTFGFTHPRILKLFVAGVFSLTASFFLTIGLLQHFDLSFFYPIQGSTVVIITIAAAIFLREKLSVQLIIGSVLISTGIVVVSFS
jgi:drug/metabolite transporter (DMT)-like permease